MDCAIFVVYQLRVTVLYYQWRGQFSLQLPRKGRRRAHASGLQADGNPSGRKERNRQIAGLCTLEGHAVRAALVRPRPSPAQVRRRRRQALAAPGSDKRRIPMTSPTARPLWSWSRLMRSSSLSALRSTSQSFPQACIQMARLFSGSSGVAVLSTRSPRMRRIPTASPSFPCRSVTVKVVVSM